MDVRVIIASHPNQTYQVGVLAPDRPCRSWLKLYTSKLLCFAELTCIGLMTELEKTEARSSDFDIHDRILIIHTETEAEILRAAGFEEQRYEYIN